MNIERLVLGSLKANCYIVYNDETKEAAIFDPADNGEKIADEIKKEGLNLKYIIITHAHCDHIMALDYVKEKFPDSKICIGKYEAEALNDDYLSLCVHFGVRAPLKKADILISDGDVLYLGSESLKFLHTPGHTKGGICAFTDDFVISGDTLFFESVGRCDFPGGNMKELIKSIKEKLFSLPDKLTVYPGHNEASTILHEKKNNPYIW